MIENEYRCSEYHTERLKSILNELFSFCNTYNRNYIAICGINYFMWDKLITHWCYYNNPYFGALIEESKDKNEVIINYKGNHVLLKRVLNLLSHIRINIIIIGMFLKTQFKYNQYV